MKLLKLVDERFQSMLSKLIVEPLPLKTAFKLKGILRKTQEEYAKYEEVRKNALEKYGKKNEDGTLATNETGGVIFEGDSMENFVKDLNDLVNLEIEMEKVKLSDLGDKIKLSAQELIAVEDILEV